MINLQAWVHWKLKDKDLSEDDREFVLAIQELINERDELKEHLKFEMDMCLKSMNMYMNGEKQLRKIIVELEKQLTTPSQQKKHPDSQ